MPDQADKLRQLIGSTPPAAPSPVLAPPMIAVAGGKAGVGATTVAVNLAAALTDYVERVLVIDAAEGRSNLAEVAGLSAADLEYTLSDVMDGRCTVAEAIAPGPARMRVLASRGRHALLPTRPSRRHTAVAASTSFSRHAQQRLLSGLHSLHDEVDLVVVDIGSGLTPWTRRFWLRAQLVVLVTTAESEVILDTYATIKRSVADAIGPDLRLLVNRCDSERKASGIHQRLAQACRQFLGCSLPALPALPRDGTGVDMRHIPRIWTAPHTPFGHAGLWLGRSVSDLMSARELQAVATTAA